MSAPTDQPKPRPWVLERRDGTVIDVVRYSAASSAKQALMDGLDRWLIFNRKYDATAVPFILAAIEEADRQPAATISVDVLVDVRTGHRYVAKVEARPEPTQLTLV